MVQHLLINKCCSSCSTKLCWTVCYASLNVETDGSNMLNVVERSWTKLRWFPFRSTSCCLLNGAVTNRFSVSRSRDLEAWWNHDNMSVDWVSWEVSLSGGVVRVMWFSWSVIVTEGAPRKKWRPCEWNFCNYQGIICPKRCSPLSSPNSVFVSLSLAAFQGYSATILAAHNDKIKDLRCNEERSSLQTSL